MICPNVLIDLQILQEEQQLQGIGGSNNSKQYQIILQMNEGPVLQVEANVVTDIVSKHPLLNPKDEVDIIKKSK